MAAAGAELPKRAGTLTIAGSVLTGGSKETETEARKKSLRNNLLGGHTSVEYNAEISCVHFPGRHWTENPAAMETMKAMSFSYAVPSLQPRLTKFHGTRVPVLISFCLLSTEIGRLAILDTFWKRITQHPMLWQGVYCRDYGSKRCVWRTLEGRAGSEKCLCHLGNTNPAEFVRVCKSITAIPGRSKEELLEAYRNWRAEQKEILALVDEMQMKKEGLVVRRAQRLRPQAWAMLKLLKMLLQLLHHDIRGQSERMQAMG